MQVSVHVIRAMMDIPSELELSLKVFLKVQKQYQHNKKKANSLSLISHFSN